ncbi:SDR family NAD(P)-dependent oxidoreductase [Ornithinimicrobium sp. W1679]|uniref:SDR family NAD(P)-dependent oxidoreductase n=1 Tax=Ornithinimicrobium sp. W1679 TaxID=3418770 RepID=UPI003CF89C3C
MTPLDYARMFRLDGRHAVVVGCGGIGAEIAAGLAAQGARVSCLDKDEAVAAAVRDRLFDNGGERDLPTDGGDRTGGAGHAAYRVDVLAEGALARAAEELGDVDVLVLTAAMNVRKRLLDYTGEEFDRVVGLNLRATFDAARAFVPRMGERGAGSVVVLTSIRAVTVEPGQGVYAATKAGAMQLVRTLAAELGPDGVRVNAVAPGVVETPLTQQIRDDADWGRAYAEKSALGRWARPEEMVGAVCWLASDAASFVTGSQVMVDGGWTAIDGRFTPPT